EHSLESAPIARREEPRSRDEDRRRRERAEDVERVEPEREPPRHERAELELSHGRLPAPHPFPPHSGGREGVGFAGAATRAIASRTNDRGPRTTGTAGRLSRKSRP